jgi:hypothetical protein
VADHLVPNRIWEFLEILKTGVLVKGFGIKSLQKFSRRRFKEFEDAPFAAYKETPQKNETFVVFKSLSIDW